MSRTSARRCRGLSAARRSDARTKSGFVAQPPTASRWLRQWGLEFDSAAAVEAASLAAERQRAGRPVDMRDTQIAGIALARHAMLATRNVRHFLDLKVPVVDPWQAQEQ